MIKNFQFGVDSGDSICKRVRTVVYNVCCSLSLVEVQDITQMIYIIEIFGLKFFQFSVWPKCNPL